MLSELKNQSFATFLCPLVWSMHLHEIANISLLDMCIIWKSSRVNLFVDLSLSYWVLHAVYFNVNEDHLAKYWQTIVTSIEPSLPLQQEGILP